MDRSGSPLIPGKHEYNLGMLDGLIWICGALPASVRDDFRVRFEALKECYLREWREELKSELAELKSEWKESDVSRNA